MPQPMNPPAVAVSMFVFVIQSVRLYPPILWQVKLDNTISWFVFSQSDTVPRKNLLLLSGLNPWLEFVLRMPTGIHAKNV